MKSRFAGVRALVLRAGLALSVCAFAGAGVDVAGAADVGQGGYIRYYHKQQLALALDASRVAVRAEDAATVGKALAGAGAAGEVTDANIKGWWLVTMAKAVAPAEIEATVAKLAGDPAVAMASPVFFDDFGGPAFVCGDLMVGFGERVPVATRDWIIAQEGFPGALKVRDYTLGVDRLTPVSKNGFEVLAAANRLAQRADVMFAEPDWAFTGHSDVIPNDTFFGDLWGIHNTGQAGGTVDMDMDGPEAWDITTGSNAVIVTIIDVGTDLTHPDLNLAPGADFAGTGANGGPSNACDNHGTAVAGCVSARFNNNLGVVGIAPSCRSSPAKCFNSVVPCNGNWSAQGSWTVDALNFAQANGHRVTNNSNGYGFTLAAIDTAYLNTWNAGIVHFASNGNSGASTIGYPANIPVVNGVCALQRNGNRASFSQYGPGTDFSAPGQTISSTDRQGAAGYTGTDYNVVDGTSFASPYSAGVAALVISRNPALTSAQVETIMRNTAVDRGAAGFDNEYGAGFVNAYGAVQAASPAPGNNSCGSAIDVSAGGTFNGTLVGATNDGTATCGSSGTNPDVWYRYTNPTGTAVTLTASTCGTHDASGVDTGMDTVLSILDGCGGTQLGCNDDAGGGCGASDTGILRDSLVTVNVAGGQTVLIRVSKFSSVADGPFRLNISTVPVNDACASAVDVSAGGGFSGSLVGATNDGTATCGLSGTNPDVWYSYTNTGPCDVTLTASTCGTNPTNVLTAVDSVLAVFSACGGTQLGCNDDNGGGCGGSGGDLDSLVTVPVANGQTVLIRVSKYGTRVVGPFVLNISASPANDQCGNATTISAGVDTAFCTIGATTDGPTEAACNNASDNNVNQDVWYRYTPVTSGKYTVRTCGSAFDTRLAVYPNACPGATGTVLACNDDSNCATGDGVQSSVTVAGAAGVPNLIRVGGYFSDVGTGTLRIYCAPDVNLSGAVTVQDIFDFLAYYFSNDPRGDFNGVGGISVQDIFDFLAAYFGGC